MPISKSRSTPWIITSEWSAIRMTSWQEKLTSSCKQTKWSDIALIERTVSWSYAIKMTTTCSSPSLRCITANRLFVTNDQYAPDTLGDKRCCCAYEWLIRRRNCLLAAAFQATPQIIGLYFQLNSIRLQQLSNRLAFIRYITMYTNSCYIASAFLFLF